MNNTLTIISAPWIVPVEPRNCVLENHCVVIENGKIKELCETDQALARYPDVEWIERPDHLLMPGLINAHTHAAMSLFRGLADDLVLSEWLEDHIWPAESKWMDAEFVKDGTQLAIAEMLCSGTTCFNDMYFFPEIAAKVAQDMGVRATIGLPVIDFPTNWASGPDECFSKGLNAYDEIKSLSRVSAAFGPHAPYTVSDGPLQELQTYADELQVPIHMHVHETEQETFDAVANSGKRPLQRLNELGLLNPRMIAVHMTALEDDEIDLTAEQGVHVVHCPSSNAKLASGQCRVHDLLAAGVNVCLGTDSAASNNNLDMLSEMRIAALNGKLKSTNAQVLPAWQVLEMATINGAKALNQDDVTGSLAPGKSADIIAINLNNVATQPVYNPISQIVYSVSREQVSDVWVEGNRLLKNRTLSNIDLPQLLEKTKLWAAKIKPAQNAEN